jgi:hypothetical protein
MKYRILYAFDEYEKGQIIEVKNMSYFPKPHYLEVVRKEEKMKYKINKIKVNKK